MLKHILAYDANPSYANALKVKKHADKFPMSVCLLFGREVVLYDDAMSFAKRGY
jgi:hypothetical protein